MFQTLTLSQTEFSTIYEDRRRKDALRSSTLALQAGAWEHYGQRWVEYVVATGTVTYGQRWVECVVVTGTGQRPMVHVLVDGRYPDPLSLSFITCSTQGEKIRVGGYVI